MRPDDPEKVKWTPNTGQLGRPVFVMVLPHSALRERRIGRPPGCPIVECLMGAILVVEPEVGRQARHQLRNQSIVFDVDILVFNTPPESLHEHVV